MNPRIIESLGLFFLGLAYGAVLLILGSFMTGAGHGTGLFYLLAASPCLYLNNTPVGWLVFLFWPVLFALLPWNHQPWVLTISLTALALHYGGILYGFFREAGWGWDESLGKLLYAVILFAVFYLAGQGLILRLMLRWRKRVA